MPFDGTVHRIAEDAAGSGDPNESVEAFVLGGDGSTMAFSPFSTKLLMYLRLSGIKHTTGSADVQKAPKSKVPYVKHGANLVGDSQLIIRYLENTFDVKKLSAGVADRYELTHAFLPFSQLSASQQAKSDLIRLACESELYWTVVSIRWAGAYGITKTEKNWDITAVKLFDDIPAIFRSPLVRFIRSSVLRDSYGQGFGRHSAADQLYLAKRAISALSVMLGSDPFFLGKNPSECDCIAFGTIEQLLADSIWPNELTSFVRREFPNLVEYCDRIRNTVFRDVQPGQRFPPGCVN